MRYWIATLAGIGLGLCAIVGTSQPPNAETPPEEALKGRWLIESIANDRIEIRCKTTQPFEFKFFEDRMIAEPGIRFHRVQSYEYTFSLFKDKSYETVTFIDGGEGWKIKIDAKSSPMKIQLERNTWANEIQGDRKKDKFKQQKLELEKQYGIFRFAGDALELCLSASRQPTSFEATSTQILVQLKRRAPE